MIVVFVVEVETGWVHIVLVVVYVTTAVVQQRSLETRSILVQVTTVDQMSVVRKTDDWRVTVCSVCVI